MLFLVISTPLPGRPTTVTAARKRYWTWMAPMLKSGMSRMVYARVGRGAVALFDVDGNQTLHRLINEWSDIIPAHFEVYPLLDPAEAQKYLASTSPRGGRRKSRSWTRRRRRRHAALRRSAMATTVRISSPRRSP